MGAHSYTLATSGWFEEITLPLWILSDITKVYPLTNSKCQVNLERSKIVFFTELQWVYM